MQNIELHIKENKKIRVAGDSHDELTKTNSYIQITKQIKLSSHDPNIKSISEMIINSNKKITFILTNLCCYEEINKDYIDVIINADKLIIPMSFRIQNNNDDIRLINTIKKSKNAEKIIINKKLVITKLVTDVICDKPFLTLIEIMMDGLYDLDNIYRILNIKTLKTIRFNFTDYRNYYAVQLVILINYILTNLDRHINIVIELNIVVNLYKHINRHDVFNNFKFEKYKKSNYFRVLNYNFIPLNLRKFHNLFDLNINYNL